MITEPSLIVQSVLRFSERQTITRNRLVGRMRGAEIADWLSLVYSNDGDLDMTEPFISSDSGKHLTSSLTWCFPAVGDRIAPLVAHCCIAAVGIVPVQLGTRARILAFRDTATELSWRAVAFAAGQHNALDEEPGSDSGVQDGSFDTTADRG